MSGSEDGGVGPGWFVIEGFHQDPATVVAGPMDLADAEGHARFLTGSDSRIMHTPALVNAVKHDGYNVEWGDGVERPEALRGDVSDPAACPHGHGSMVVPVGDPLEPADPYCGECGHIRGRDCDDGCDYGGEQS